MKHQYLRSIIIVSTQTLLPIIALLLIGPCLLQSQAMKNWQEILSHSQPWCMLLHALLYSGFVILWPRVINKLKPQTPLNTLQLKTLHSMRWYLLAVFLLIDTLVLWSQP